MHADSTFLPVPELCNILIARVVSQEWGATEFASTRAGWADIPEEMKAKGRGKGFWHHYFHSQSKISPELAGQKMFHNWPEQHWHTVWPNPVTGEEALYIASHAYAVNGYEKDEGQALIDELTAFVTQPEYVYSHKWTPGNVVM